jgi:Protein of unknown function (DUF3574)
MRRHLGSIASAALIAGLGACATPPACAPGAGKPTAVFTLYLGKAIRGRSDVTDQEWQSFLDHTVTVVLPNGYTVLDASGAWMNPITHHTVSEATKVLIAALPDTPASVTAINHIRLSYQTEFHQQLVGMTIEQACADF